MVHETGWSDLTAQRASRNEGLRGLAYRGLALRLGLRPRSGHSPWLACHERTWRFAGDAAPGESNGGGGSRTRVRKACRYRNLRAYPSLLFRARRKRTAKAPGPSPRSLAGSIRTLDPASLLNGVRSQPVGWKRGTSRGFMPRVQAASSQLHCFSTGLTSTWRSARIQQSLAPVEAVSPPQRLCCPMTSLF